MTDKVCDYIAENSLLRRGDRVLVALSGGADSMCLLHILASLSERLEIEVSACHVNHGLRASESDDEERFVYEHCEKYGIRLEVYHAKMNERERPIGIGTEEWARKLRYGYLEDAAKKHRAIIATAHTLSDNAETLLLNLTRGTGIGGLCGIPVKRGDIIRPILCLTRGDTEKYCNENGILYCVDSSNFDTSYSRNRIRANVIPELRKINGGFYGVISSFILRMNELDKYISAECARALPEVERKDGLDANKTSDYPKEIAHRLLVNRFGMLDDNKTTLILDCARRGSGGLQIEEDRYICVENGLIVEKKADIKLKGEYIEPLSEGVFKPFDGFSFTVKPLQDGEVLNYLKQSKKELNNCIDCGKIKGSCLIRSRRAGDEFRQYGRGVTKSLKKLFNELKIPEKMRDVIPVIADESGVIWVYGVGADERVVPGKESKKIFVINISEDK